MPDYHPSPATLKEYSAKSGDPFAAHADGAGKGGH
jgi:hypothetical protein